MVPPSLQSNHSTALKQVSWALGLLGVEGASCAGDFAWVFGVKNMVMSIQKSLASLDSNAGGPGLSGRQGWSLPRD